MDISDVDRVSPLRSLLRWAARPSRPDQESWRRLALRLMHVDASQGDGPRSAMIVTAGAGDLEAGCCLELAASLADELGKPVLLVDVAPRDRRLSSALKCDGLRGFTDAIFDPQVPLAEIVMQTTHPQVRFVAAGITPEPTGGVAAARMGALLEGFRRDHEVVLLAGGAVPANGLALALAPAVSRVVLLAVENDTGPEAVDAAQESLRARSAREIGLVLVKRS